MGWKYQHRRRCVHFGVTFLGVVAVIDRERSRCLALRFDGKPGAPRGDDEWVSLIGAFERARDEHSATRVMARLMEAKYVPQPGDVLKALAADTICSDCGDTGWKPNPKATQRCLCVEYGLAPKDCWKCKGAGRVLSPGVASCHCRTAKAAA